MRIEEIHIDGFGVWRDRHWTGLGPGVNVFLGPNEAGKTTLMNFVRSVLFGFDRRNQPGRYEPLRGGTHGGSLAVRYRERSVVVERTAGRHVRGAVSVRVPNPGGGAASGDAAAPGEAGDLSLLSLDDMLGGTTRTLYHNVFAFGLEELEQFRTLQDTEVGSYVSGAGMGIGASRWTTVSKDLEDRRSRLFLPRGQKTTINTALRELETVRDAIERTAEEPEEYARALERRAILRIEIGQADERIRTLDSRVTRDEKLRRYEPHRKRRVEIESSLDRMRPDSAVDRFPEGGVERLNLLLHQRRQIDGEIAKHREEVERIRAERIELARGYSPQELVRRERVVENLCSSLPRLDALDESLSGTGNLVRSIEEDQRAAEARRTGTAPPSGPIMLGFAGAVAVVVAVLFLAGNLVAATGVATIVSMIVLWYQGRRRRLAEIDAEIRGIGRRLGAAEQERKRISGERDRILDHLEAQTGRRQFSTADIEREAAHARRLKEVADRIRAIDDTLSGENRHRLGMEGRLQENASAVGALLGEAGASTDSDFFRRAEIFSERQVLRAELERIPRIDIELAGEGAAPPPPLMSPEEYRMASDELERSRECLNALRNEEGRIEERLEKLSMSGDRTRARARQEAILAAIDEAAADWAVLTLCRTLLEETRKIYESDRQPEVLKKASAFLSRMSSGSWVRVVSRLGTDDIVVESAAGERISPENLSRGTAEQLYLAMRLALVEEYSRHVEALPVILDDIFVNFDPERTRRAIESVSALAGTHQVLMFTCHPHLAALVAEVVPGAPSFSLG
jgi:uncharacterized protein YhaN